MGRLEELGREGDWIGEGVVGVAENSGGVEGHHVVWWGELNCRDILVNDPP